MSGSTDPGAAAAAGFQYQYLIALRDLLDAVEAGPRRRACAIRLEPGPAAGGDDAYVVDYEVLDSTSAVIRAVQVKSRLDPVHGRAMGRSDVVAIMRRLNNRCAESSQLITNARPGEQLVDLCAVEDAGAGVRRRLDGRLLVPGAASAAAAGGPATFEVLFLPETRHELKAELQRRVWSYRHARAERVGHAAAGMLVNYLLQIVFERATEMSGLVTVDELEELLLTDAMTVAASMGRFTWGRQLGTPPPPTSVVPRPEELEKLAVALNATSPLVVRRDLAITGLSGIGKTNLVVAYVSEHAHLYDFILWVNAESPDSVDSAMLDFLEVMDQRGHVPGAVRSTVRDFLSTVAAHWLVVFDNAPNETGVLDWLPTSGHGHSITTSTNAARWLQSDAQIRLREMNVEEAAALVLARFGAGELESSAGAPYEEATNAARYLAESLECWPLALELGVAYLRGAGIPLLQADRYVRLLADQMDDVQLLPPGYPRTLQAAITMAIDRALDTGNGAGAESARRIATCIAQVGARAIPADLLENIVRLWSTADRVEVDLTSTSGSHEFVNGLRRLNSGSLIDSSRVRLGLQDVWVLEVNEIVRDSLARRTEVRERADHARFALANGLTQRLRIPPAPDRLGDLMLAEHHAGVLIPTLVAGGFASAPVAFLLGNMATVKELRGQYEIALDLNRVEDRMISRLFPGAIEIRAQLASQAAGLLMHTSTDGGDVTAELGRSIALLEAAGASRFEWKYLDQMLTAMVSVAATLAQTKDDPVAAALVPRVVALFPGGADSRAAAAALRLAELEALADEDLDAQADELAALISSRPSELEEVALRARLCEVLVRAGRYASALEHLARADRVASALGFGYPTIVLHSLNAALAVAVELLGESALDRLAALGVLAELLDVAGRRMSGASSFDEARANLYRAIHAVGVGDSALARVLLKRARTSAAATSDELLVKDTSGLFRMCDLAGDRLTEYEALGTRDVYRLTGYRRLGDGEFLNHVLVAAQLRQEPLPHASGFIASTEGVVSEHSLSHPAGRFSGPEQGAPEFLVLDLWPRRIAVRFDADGDGARPVARTLEAAEAGQPVRFYLTARDDVATMTRQMALELVEEAERGTSRVLLRVVLDSWTG